MRPVSVIAQLHHSQPSPRCIFAKPFRVTQQHNHGRIPRRSQFRGTGQRIAAIVPRPDKQRDARIGRGSGAQKIRRSLARAPHQVDLRVDSFHRAKLCRCQQRLAKQKRS